MEKKKNQLTKPPPVNVRNYVLKLDNCEHTQSASLRSFGLFTSSLVSWVPGTTPKEQHAKPGQLGVSALLSACAQNSPQTSGTEASGPLEGRALLCLATVSLVPSTMLGQGRYQRLNEQMKGDEM